MKKILLPFLFIACFCIANPKTTISNSFNIMTIWKNIQNNAIQAKNKMSYSNWNDEITLSEDESSNRNPFVVMNNNNFAIAAWEKYDANTSYIQTRLFDKTNGFYNIVAISDTQKKATIADLALSQDNDGIILWEVNENGGNYIQAKLYSQLLGWSDTYTLTDIGNVATNVSVATTEDIAIVVWQELDGSNNIIKAKIHDYTNGWQETVTLTNNFVNSTNPKVDINSSKKAMVVWNCLENGSNIIYGKKYDISTGWDDTILISENNVQTESPIVQISERNNIYVTWIEIENEKGFVQAKKYDIDMNWQEIQTISDKNLNAKNLYFFYGSSDIGIACWEIENGVNNSYLQSAYTIPSSNKWLLPINITGENANSQSMYAAKSSSMLAEIIWEEVGENTTTIKTATNVDRSVWIDYYDLITFDQ